MRKFNLLFVIVVLSFTVSGCTKRTDSSYQTGSIEMESGNEQEYNNTDNNTVNSIVDNNVSFSSQPEPGPRTEVLPDMDKIDMDEIRDSVMENNIDNSINDNSNGAPIEEIPVDNGIISDLPIGEKSTDTNNDIISLEPDTSLEKSVSGVKGITINTIKNILESYGFTEFTTSIAPDGTGISVAEWKSYYVEVKTDRDDNVYELWLSASGADSLDVIVQCAGALCPESKGWIKDSNIGLEKKIGEFSFALGQNDDTYILRAVGDKME